MSPYSNPGEGRCKGEHCGARIRWALTESRREAIPLDHDPNDDGNVILVDELARVLGPLECELLADDAVRYMPHHATCPDYLAFRKAVAHREATR